MAEITANLNWLAIIIGTVLSFLLGWFWYSTKLFGTKWASGNNIDLSSGDRKMPVAPMLLQLVATFFLAWLIGVTAASNALLTAILILVVIALLIAANGAFAKKSSAAIWIATTFILVFHHCSQFLLAMVLCRAPSLMPHLPTIAWPKVDRKKYI